MSKSIKKYLCIMLSMVLVLNFTACNSEKEEVAEGNNYNLVALYVTDIVKNGSYIIYNTKGKSIIDLAYDNEDIEQGHFIPNCVSRKKHVVPLIMEIFDN